MRPASLNALQRRRPATSTTTGFSPSLLTEGAVPNGAPSAMGTFAPDPTYYTPSTAAATRASGKEKSWGRRNRRGRSFPAPFGAVAMGTCPSLTIVSSDALSVVVPILERPLGFAAPKQPPLPVGLSRPAMPRARATQAAGRNTERQHHLLAQRPEGTSENLIDSAAGKVELEACKRELSVLQIKPGASEIKRSVGMVDPTTEEQLCTITSTWNKHRAANNHRSS
eukprot:g16323.t1